MKGDNIRNFFIHLFLICGVIIVLLPLFWMLITAFKQIGQGMKFTFFPSTESYSSSYIIDFTEKYNNKVIFEYINPSAQTVTIAGTFNNWDKEKNQLKNDNGIWRIELNDLPAGKLEYKFVVNGSQWIYDPDNPNKADNSILEIGEKGIFTNKKLNNATQIKENNKVLFKYFGPQYKKVFVEFQGKVIDLLKDDEGYWTTLMELPEGKYSYKFILEVPFKTALNSLYTLDNFKKVLFNPDFPFSRFFFNSLVVATGCAFLTSLFCLLGGYAFAKKQFIFKDKLFLILLASMMVPGMIFMVPQFAIVNKLGWINSYWAMIIPHLGNVFGLFLLTQYIKTIPDSLFEAAKIDGASELQVFRIIVLPLSLPIIVTLFLLTFIGQWSNFLWQLIVNTPNSPYRTLPVGLALFRGQYATDWELMMAGACFSILPIAILFLVAQRFFIEGMTQGAVKE
ncbi:MAG TPA: ABC transporter permease subunit [bacterium]|nr:ABC transporter permease subunit [bacterium]HOL47436.1 ABC transporter permease subunit [bacterium]HPQ19503.1 ABC transporter permease subunit [bacterium]